MNNKKRDAILQMCFGCKNEDISEFVVFTPLPVENLNDFKMLCNVKKDFSGWLGSGFAGLAEDTPITVICPGTGSSQIGDATLALSYTSCKIVIFVGSIGGLSDGMKIGDIVVVEDAIIGEGFSRYHLSKKLSKDVFGKVVKANNILVNDLLSKTQVISNKLSIAVHKGKVFTTESLFAETEQFLEDIRENNCIGIEKEASAFYTAAKKAKIKAAVLLCVSDLPLHKKSLLEKRTKEEEEKRVKVRHNIIPQVVMSVVQEYHHMSPAI